MINVSELTKYRFVFKQPQHRGVICHLGTEKTDSYYRFQTNAQQYFRQKKKILFYQ